jgi:hypothetical protein
MASRQASAGVASRIVIVGSASSVMRTKLRRSSAARERA